MKDWKKIKDLYKNVDLDRIDMTKIVVSDKDGLGNLEKNTKRSK